MAEELKKMFDECLKTTGNNKIQACRRFIVAAKKRYPAITMKECMDICGYSSDNPERKLALEQSFRVSIVNPTRDYLAKTTLKMEDGSALFKRTAKSDVEKANRKKILAMLPSSRTKRSPGVYLDDLIAE